MGKNSRHILSLRDTYHLRYRSRKYTNKELVNGLNSRIFNNYSRISNHEWVRRCQPGTAATPTCVCVLHKTSHPEILRRSRAVTVKICTKKCDARAEVLVRLLGSATLMRFRLKTHTFRCV